MKVCRAPYIPPAFGKEALTRFLETVESVTRAREDIRRAIKNPDIAWLLTTSACDRCVGFVAMYYGVDKPHTDEVLRRYEAGELLFVLAAMQGGSEHDTLEALCVMGVRSIDAQGQSREKRLRFAGGSRRRPVTNARHYERYGHLARMEQRVTSELHTLVARPDRLELALETNGMEAMAKYI
jgi:hypothetical protein